MKIETQTVTKLVISDMPNLDPITVFLEDLEPRKGKATITCYNESWTAYWGGMGDKTIAEFILSCNEDYLVGNFSEQIEFNRIDLEAMVDHAKKHIIKRRKAKDIDSDQAREQFDKTESLENMEHDSTLFDVHYELMQEIFGDEWWYGLPQKPNPKYIYLCRILNTVKEALRHINYAPGDRVAINQLIAPEDLPIGSLGTFRKWDDICTDMVIIDWDAGWSGVYCSQQISKI